MSEWINAYERKPDKIRHTRRSVSVLAWDKVRSWCFAHYDFEVALWRGNGVYDPNITHWMPLPPEPQPPKEEL